MIRTNPYYSRLQSSYLFSQIAKRVAAFQQEYPERELIRMGIGDVTRPLTPGVIRAMHAAVDDLSAEETFRGYAPDLGYAFLREAIARVDFQERGCGISPDEIFVSDGAKCDSANIQEIFDADCRIVEMVELPGHPFFAGTQSHPEFKSRPNRPHPLFRGFVEAAKRTAEEKRER